MKSIGTTERCEPGGVVAVAVGGAPGPAAPDPPPPPQAGTSRETSRRRKRVDFIEFRLSLMMLQDKK